MTSLRAAFYFKTCNDAKWLASEQGLLRKDISLPSSLLSSTVFKTFWSFQGETI